MADTAYERVLCVKNEVHVYRIPPRPSNRGYRADDWKLDSPDWTGRLRVLSINNNLFLKLEDKNNGELFAQCPVEEYPGIAIEPVVDSSRYFVIRIKDDSGKSAFIGIGFHDRADSFDLNVSVQDHFKWLRQEAEEAKSSKELSKAPKLDLGFKEGQTITLNLGTKRADGKPRSRPAAAGKSGGLGFLPPPPGSKKTTPAVPAPSSAPLASNSQPSQQPISSSTGQENSFLLDFGGPEPFSTAQKPPAAQSQQPDLWGDFTSARASQATSNNSVDELIKF